MSPVGWWEGSSRPHQRVRRTSMQAAKLSEDDGVSSSSSQLLELNDESSQAKTAKRGMLVSPDDVALWLEVWVLALVAWVLAQVYLALVLEKNMFPLWLQHVMRLVLVMLPVLPLLSDDVVLLMLLGMLVWVTMDPRFPLWFDMVVVVRLLLWLLTLRRNWRDILLYMVLCMLVWVTMKPRFPLYWRDILLYMLVVLLLLLPLPRLLTLERIMNFWRACMHRSGGSLVKWGPPHEWVMDSGAWNHRTSNLELLLEGGDFQSFQEMDNKDASSSGDVQWRGSVRTSCFAFPGVQYVVGDDTRNVVSVSQLARDHGLVTVFEPTSCHVKNKKTGKIVGKGHLRNGMYILDSLRVIGQDIGDGGASGGDHRDGGGGGRGQKAQGNNDGEGDSTAERRGGGTGARNQEEGSGSGAEINEEGEGGDEKEIEEMKENDKDDIKEIGETNGTGEKEEDEKRGGENSGPLSSRPHTGLFGMSRLACILWIAACILLPYTSWGARRVTILAMNFYSLAAGFWVLFILVLLHLNPCMMQSTICKLKQIGYLFRGTSGDGESNEENTWKSHEEQYKQLFGLSRFDVTSRDSTVYYGGRQLPAGAFSTSTNEERWEEFLVDSGASFHMTWQKSILFPYRQDLENHYKPPIDCIEGIAGSIKVTESGYLNGKIMLDGVLLVPESRMNLVSVGQLSVQYQVRVEMDHEGFIIKKLNGAKIGEGKMLLDNHVYVLEEFKPPGDIFAHLREPHPNIFGLRSPGPAQ